MIATKLRTAIRVGAHAVAQRVDDINKLNVFPVPDGDTGTNMSLTLQSVVDEVDRLPTAASISDIAQAVTHASLMGARGNSGVITSQILRGFAEYLSTLNEPEAIEAKDVSKAFKQSVKVAFQAVRKPVEGTILTVLKETSVRLEEAARKRVSFEEAIEIMAQEAYKAVERTPDKLEVLRENGVVDAGGMGLAIFLEGVAESLLGRSADVEPMRTPSPQSGLVAIEAHDDWDDSAYTYCTEFLFHGTGLNEEKTRAFLMKMGDCDLLVGCEPSYKIHVHTDRPDKVLAYMLDRGSVSEVHIHNMHLQAHERTAALHRSPSATPAPSEPVKDLGFVAVASGDGTAHILHSLGVDVVISGGQTMNPSTKDILDGIARVPAKQVIVFPNNKNIIMAAQSAVSACALEAAVVPSRSVLQCFSALIEANPEDSLANNVEAMTEACKRVVDGEVTTAVKDSKAADGSPIHAGDVMGILNGSIDVVGSEVVEVACRLIDAAVSSQGGDIITILTGADFDESSSQNLVEQIEKRYPLLEVEVHHGGQPLYPVVFSLE